MDPDNNGEGNVSEDDDDDVSDGDDDDDDDTFCLMASSCGIKETVARSRIPITINTSHS